ncbi:unnamed protein product [Cunninghamella echinulata]
MYLRGFRQLNTISKVNNYTRRLLHSQNSHSQKLIPLFFTKRHFSSNFASRDNFPMLNNN